MARQSTTPVQFSRTRRVDENIAMTSGRAGKVIPLTYVPVLRGDSASGKVGVDIDLAEMPRPLLNAVGANIQAWFVPKSCHPQFSGQDEFMNAYQGQTITALGQADRAAPEYFMNLPVNLDNGDVVANSEVFKTLGLHLAGDKSYNVDLVDALALIHNFRLAAHSSRLERRKYAAEDYSEVHTLPRAFWPSGRFSRIVPDYERALIVGSLDLDVSAGQIPVEGIGIENLAIGDGARVATNAWSDSSGSKNSEHWFSDHSAGNRVAIEKGANNLPQIFANMVGSNVGVTLADIDKARVRKEFAQLRQTMAGNDPTGFASDDAIVAELMQGLRVPEDQFKRPWLLDSKRVTFGMVERYATDAANLDASVSQGRASAQLSINLPQTEAGGLIVVVMEVLPERIYERQADEWLYMTKTEQLPDALRDVQRPEPVDMVENYRIDARHSSPDGLYGYEPMNDKWNRSTTRLGGAFYQADPSNPWTEQRSAIWQTNIVDPQFTEDHWLAPENFPHDVFSDITADAFEVVCRHNITLVGLTQIGDVLAEANDDYQAVEDAAELSE
ncbi:MAG: hypothetical protein ABJN39_20245 [Sulfitobacter sp.]|uniref:hypothetical protein n=1 Tax=Sulfitobacter sp. TaxID=1903071 RepID=UPI00329A1E66